ncbi:altered inheritance rate of mitochondria protein 25 [Vigna unguiculata]|uniref:Phospholipid scramblase n=1 Tax=Vigna unguiculata TaxID=3917 RepID=A0A4D6LJU9_VIGUN|nr:altered inheritance rate of mitochondria protein 25 [Vigna unguiculata]QCD88847.1 Scramblase [Vigna unguiculata]
MKNWPREGWKWLSNIANSSVRFHGNVATVAAKHNRNPFTLARPFGSAIDGGNEVDLHRLTREFLANLWIDDRKMANPRGRKLVKSCGGYGGDPRWFSASSGVVGRGKRRPGLKQPPISQSVSEFFEPLSPLEAKVAPLLARSNLLITRDIEWANLVMGFEQENRYAIVDACYPQSPVGYIREQSNVVIRQLLRLRRPFVAHITDGLGTELFRVRRPFWWITSSIYAEVDGQEVGVVHRRWHLWRRIYDLYLGNKQFAVVENPGLWNWTFTLKDINGEVLAQIDRDWRGFGFEILTDAGQYVIRFGSSDPSSKIGLANAIEDLEVSRTLTLAERAVTVALAISLDNDYFSRHGGWGLPFLVAEE